MISIAILLLCVAFQFWLVAKHRREMSRMERRRAALLEQTALLKSIATARANGDNRTALALCHRFNEHDEAVCRDFPELKPK